MTNRHLKSFTIAVALASAFWSPEAAVSSADETLAPEPFLLCLQEGRRQLDDQDDRPRPTRMPVKMPPDGVDFTNDYAIRMVAETQVNRLIKDDKAIKCSALAGQLDRSTCDVALPDESRQQVASQKLYVEGCKSIVVVFVSRKHNDHWHVVSAATGFFIAAGVIATNRHVFEDKDEYMFAMTADAKVHPIKEVLAANIDNDAALCRIEAKNYKPLALRTAIPVGAPVRVISHPKGRYYTLSQGLVSRKYLRPPSRPKKPGDDDKKPGDDNKKPSDDNKKPSDDKQSGAKDSNEKHVRTSVTKWVTITAGFGLGSSGGPVFDRFGNVLGIATSTQSIRVGGDDDQFSQMVFRDCVPAEIIQAMIAEAEDQKSGDDA